MQLDTLTWTTSWCSRDSMRYAVLVTNEPTSQPSITSKKVLDVTLEPGSSKRSW
jgi:hypothetical protein